MTAQATQKLTKRFTYLTPEQDDAVHALCLPSGASSPSEFIRRATAEHIAKTVRELAEKRREIAAGGPHHSDIRLAHSN